MKKFGFIAAAMTMLLSIASVHAAEEGINIYYDATDARNNETTRCVDVVIGGDVADVFQAGEIWFDVDESAYESYEFVPVEGVAADKIKNQFGFFYESVDASVALTDGKLGYLKFTVEAGAPEFTVTLNEDSYVEGKKCEAEVGEYATVTIPAWSTGGGEEEVETTPAGFFKYWQNDTAAAAFTATLTADQAAKTVTWTVTDGEKTKTADTTVDTSVSGAGDVVIGLVISNAVEGLTATVTVK